MSIPGLSSDPTPHVIPTITIEGTALNDETQDKLIRTVVDTHLHLPDMFEIAFQDGENKVIGDLSIAIGGHVEIFGGAASDKMGKSLIKGEITAIEGEYEGTVLHTIIRGYEKAHRMQRISHTRSFVDMKDSDIAKKIASAYNFKDVDVDDTKATHKHVSQLDQTDWDFLKFRAQEIGFEVGVAGGKFFFHKASGSKDDDGGLLDAAADLMGDVAATLGIGGPPELTFGDNLVSFRPRLSAGGLVSDVEVRVWDPKTADVIVGSKPVKTGTATLGKAPKPAEMAGMFKEESLIPIPALPQLPKIPGLKLPSFGSAPSPTARVICDRPVDRDSGTLKAAEKMAKGVGEHVGSTFAEAEGVTYGNPDIQPGQAVTIAGVPEEFKGKWIVTNARHTFVPADGGYRTSFTVSGRQDRSLLGLASLGRSNVTRPIINGFVCGVVTNNNDPDSFGRVKVSFPVFSNSYESDWARVVQFGMGSKWGALFTPEVGDEVLVGFEFGDARRPYVIGGLANGNTSHPLLSSAIKAMGPMAKVVQQGFVSHLGNQILFEDDEPVPGSPIPTKSSITISDKAGKMLIAIDKKSGEIQITADSTVPPAKITIEQKGVGGQISVKSAGNVSVEASAPGKLTLSGGAGITIDGGVGMVEVKGTAIKLN